MCIHFFQPGIRGFLIMRSIPFPTLNNPEWTWNSQGQVITGPDGRHQFIGYIVHPDSRGKGYCTEAVEIMVDYLFLSKNIVRVQAETNPVNVSSIRVLEKAGFTFEGVRRKVFFSQGKYNDGALYRVLRDEWSPRVLSEGS